MPGQELRTFGYLDAAVLLLFLFSLPLKIRFPPFPNEAYPFLFFFIASDPPPIGVGKCSFPFHCLPLLRFSFVPRLVGRVSRGKSITSPLLPACQTNVSSISLESPSPDTYFGKISTLNKKTATPWLTPPPHQLICFFSGQRP